MELILALILVIIWATTSLVLMLVAFSRPREETRQQAQEHYYYYDNRHYDNRQITVQAGRENARQMLTVCRPQESRPLLTQQHGAFLMVGERQLYNPRTGEGRPL